jgi:hypothetical protein
MQEMRRAESKLGERRGGRPRREAVVHHRGSSMHRIIIIPIGAWYSATSSARVTAAVSRPASRDTAAAAPSAPQLPEQW